MTARGDDDSNEPSDPVLDSMRSVWLSMRDEDPPSGGLTELLAAARAKAEAMQPKPSWWQRALLAMKRPPVLALATTVVLVGGAVIVAGQKDKLDTAPSVEPAPAAPVIAKDDRWAAPPTEPSNEPPPPAPVEAPPDLQKEAEATPRRESKGKATATPRPRPPVKSAPVPDQVADAPRTIEPERPAPPPGVTAETRTGGKGEDRGLVIAQDPEGGAAAPAPPPPEANNGMRLKNAAPQVDSVGDEELQVTGRARTVRGPTVEQLARQSATAAAHGDCPAVRAITSRMLKLDKAFYRDHVAGNASVKSCLK